MNGSTLGTSESVDRVRSPISGCVDRVSSWVSERVDRVGSAVRVRVERGCTGSKYVLLIGSTLATMMFGYWVSKSVDRSQYHL